MAENTVSGSAQIKFIRQGDSIASMLISTAALQQSVNQSTGIINPDWTVVANQPIIYPRVVSQLSGSLITDLSNPVWKYNGTALVFVGGKTSDGNFETTTYTISGKAIPALKILKNIMSDASQNALISFTCNVTTGGLITSVSADIPVARTEVSGEVYQGYISATNGGIVDDLNAATILTAALNKGGTGVTTGLAYAWYYNTPSDTDAVQDNWQPLNKTTKSITVTRDEVDTIKVFKCDFSVESTVVFSAFFEVRDESDPLYILPNPDQKDELLSSYQQSITYTPKVRRRGQSTDESGWSFAYVLRDVKGNSIKTATGASFAVTYANILAANCDLDLYIEATK